MNAPFAIPARPWGDAEVNYLVKNAHLLDNETRAELGLAEAPETITPEDVQAGLDAFNQLSPEEQEAVRAEAQSQANSEGSLPTDVGEDVENIDASNA